MSNRDRISRNATGGGGEYVKLPVDMKLSAGIHPTTQQPAFVMWSKEKNENLYSSAPIKGLLFIGSAMRASAFVRRGNTGYSLITAPYVNKAKVTLFDPDGGQFKKVFSGTKDDAELFIKSHYPGADRMNVKVLLYFYEHSKKRLIEFETNASIAFGDMKDKARKLSSMLMDLSPAIYNSGDITIGKKTHDMLGPLAAKNPPKYVRMEPAGTVPDEVIDSEEVTAILDTWEMWVQQNSPEERNAPVKSESQPQLPNGGFDEAFEKHIGSESRYEAYEAANFASPDDANGDLPF